MLISLVNGPDAGILPSTRMIQQVRPLEVTNFRLGSHRPLLLWSLFTSPWFQVFIQCGFFSILLAFPIAFFYLAVSL
jgi:hypothetical protein